MYKPPRGKIKYDVPTIRRAKRLIDAGIRYKIITTEMKVSAEFLGNVSNGRILLDGTRVQEKFLGTSHMSVKLLNRPYSKCDECGHDVQKPCLMCCIDSGNLEALHELILTERQQEDLMEPKKEYDDMLTYSAVFQEDSKWTK